MIFCSHCGARLAAGSHFCHVCGNRIVVREEPTRKTVYSGEVHKCPQCGEVLNAYEAFCSVCGYEIRGGSVSDYVQRFAEQLKNAATDYQKASIIQSFPIPNNREDILEFLILATSNVDQSLDEAVLSAWISKIEQSYRKAKIALREQQDLALVEDIYSEAQGKICLCRKEGPDQSKTKLHAETEEKPKSEKEMKAAPTGGKKKSDWTAGDTWLVIFVIAVMVGLFSLLFIAFNYDTQLRLEEQEKQFSQVEMIEQEAELNSIEPGTIYTYGYEMDRLYVATAVSPTVVKVEQWARTETSGGEYEKQYDLGVYRITDSENQFAWLKSGYTAFKIVIKDQNERAYKKGKEAVFTILPEQHDVGNGTNYVNTELHYEYLYNEQYLYIAVPLPDDLMKFECWYRSTTATEYAYGYDVYTISTKNELTDFTFLEGEDESFAVTMIDTKNPKMDEPVFVEFVEGPWG